MCAHRHVHAIPATHEHEKTYTCADTQTPPHTQRVSHTHLSRHCHHHCLTPRPSWQGPSWRLRWSPWQQGPWLVPPAVISTAQHNTVSTSGVRAGTTRSLPWPCRAPRSARHVGACKAGCCARLQCSPPRCHPSHQSRQSHCSQQRPWLAQPWRRAWPAAETTRRRHNHRSVLALEPSLRAAQAHH